MTSFLLSDCHHPIELQVSGAKVQRVKPQLALFLLSVDFPSSCAGLFAPKEGYVETSRV